MRNVMQSLLSRRRAAVPGARFAVVAFRDPNYTDSNAHVLSRHLRLKLTSDHADRAPPSCPAPLWGSSWSRIVRGSRILRARPSRTQQRVAVKAGAPGRPRRTERPVPRAGARGRESLRVAEVPGALSLVDAGTGHLLDRRQGLRVRTGVAPGELSWRGGPS